ncbi:hypothetical protein HHL11_24140 [Ramlibacter sp. G-1-2-2]|uniref:Uncharacterized protein n=1 Tax=Ramlibacter agri TaxID=2728837 RepID=A0A848H8Q1_9BURK|nr:hypothetical protein [Ramlibacter agri]NML46857.1 hypothetical protein [Ramlibacter agri]
MNATNDPRNDRLYALLPAIHRLRDAERGYPLKALLQVIAEQVNLVEDDIAQLYENEFIETAADWAVPYLGDLVGYRPVADAGPPADASGCREARALVPRREIANLIRTRRRKGTLALLEQLAHDIAGWPGRAVESFRLLAWAQNIDHPHLDRHLLVDLREVDALDRLDGPFDSVTHCVDVRRINSMHTIGRSNIPSVGVFAWRLGSHPVTDTPACCIEDVGPQCFTFSVLGQDAPLFVKPQPETDPSHIAGEMNLPAAIRRLAFDSSPRDFYGAGLSLAIRTDGWGGAPPGEVVPVAQILPADLSGWVYVPPRGKIAVDPVLGRLAFPPGQLPKRGVRVSYQYGFPADIGGGEYERPLLDPAEAFTLYRVGDDEDCKRIEDALARWRADNPMHAVIEITSSGVYVEPLQVALADSQTLQIRAGVRVRPVLRLIDWQTDLPDALSVTLGNASRMAFDGLIVTGRPISVVGAGEDGAPASVCGAELAIRHCTLVPGWAIDCDCEPKRPSEPSLELSGVRARVTIEHSIIGAIQVQEDEVALDPIPLCITDSILDATADDRQAIAAAGGAWAHVTLAIARCTVFGIVDVHAMALGENSVFSGCVNVARRQVGCMRFCYVPVECRTPRRYRCQPDGVIAAVKERITDDAAKQQAEIANESLRVTPQYTARRYGAPAYAQLGADCAIEIVRGADDESEMGAYHDLFQPQRAANLRARLAEYTPAGMDVGLFFAN